MSKRARSTWTPLSQQPSGGLDGLKKEEILKLIIEAYDLDKDGDLPTFEYKPNRQVLIRGWAGEEKVIVSIYEPHNKVLVQGKFRDRVLDRLLRAKNK